MDNVEQGRTLLALARSALSQHLGLEMQQEVTHEPWLDQAGATFVTLTRNQRLRGCIGSLQAHRPLYQDVQANAVAAGSRDPRFPPLSADELAQTRVEVSLLSPQEPLAFEREQDAVAQLRPGIDGVVLEFGSRCGTFLPQVWEQLPQREDFFRTLKAKAGLPADFWAPGVRLSRYTVTKWKEPL